MLQGCVAILSFTWIVSLTVFGFLVLPKGYYFNITGLMACEPFFTKPSYRILSTCALYFPTSLAMMYCYDSSFHMSRYRLNDPTPTQSLCGVHHRDMPVMNLSLALSIGMGGMGRLPNIVTKKMVPIHEKQSNGPTSRSMAAISLGFVVMATPWTIKEIVAACTGSKCFATVEPPEERKSPCCHHNLSSNSLPMPPEPPASRPPGSGGYCGY